MLRVNARRTERVLILELRPHRGQSVSFNGLTGSSERAYARRSADDDGGGQGQ